VRQIYCSTLREDQCDVSAAPCSPSLSWGDCNFSSYYAFDVFACLLFRKGMHRGIGNELHGLRFPKYARFNEIPSFSHRFVICAIKLWAKNTDST
jgi:hypothetical protein